MSQESSMHVYLNWAKQRIDEMDATLASLEAKASQAKAESKAKADQLIVDLKKLRDEFQAKAKGQAEAETAAWQANKAQMELQWKTFEGQVKNYFDTVGQKIVQQQTTFRSVAAAQVKAWREAADTFQKELGQVAAARRNDVDTAIKRMKADAADAETRLQNLKQAGSESWTALSAALAESRKAFDCANQAVSDAFKRAAPPPAA
jgi:hypothetical protein